jgi:hypothetical protein
MPYELPAQMDIMTLVVQISIQTLLKRKNS